MLNVLCTGTLIADPKERSGQSGKTFVTAVVRVPTEGEEPVIANVITFNSSAKEALLALASGDAVSFVGRAKLSAWTSRDGEQRHGINVVAERLLSAYEVEKRRQRARNAAEPEEATA